MSLDLSSKRLPADGLEAALRQWVRAGLCIFILTAVWLSTRPFMQAAPAEGGRQSSDVLNQLTFGGLAALSAGVFLLMDRRTLKPLLQPSYGLMLGWMIVAVVTSTAQDISMRAFQFTAVVMFLAAAALAFPKDEKQFAAILALVAGLVIIIDYLGVAALPGIAKHTDFDPFEPEHAGSWRGHFDHKNVAGAMMAVFTFIGFYLWRVGRRFTGLAIALLAFAFLYFTKSKTSLALTPAVMLLVLLVERIPIFALRFLMLMGVLMLMLTATLGSVLVPFVNDVVQAVAPGTNFTGRVDIWRYGFEKYVERPWLGFGLEGFWLTPTTLQGESKLELAWSVDKIVHGHNGYLDILLTLGAPGLLLVLIVFALKPMADYHRAANYAANRPLASLFLMIWFFILLGMCLESYFFRRADPVWFSLLLAVFGLRLLAGHTPPPGGAVPATARHPRSGG
jgi:O-antigen ligase